MTGGEKYCYIILLYCGRKLGNFGGGLEGKEWDGICGRFGLLVVLLLMENKM
jgi:hypothetical protein